MLQPKWPQALPPKVVPKTKKPLPTSPDAGDRRKQLQQAVAAAAKKMKNEAKAKEEKATEKNI